MTGIISFAGILIYRRISGRFQHGKKQPEAAPGEESEEHNSIGGHSEKDL